MGKNYRVTCGEDSEKTGVLGPHSKHQSEEICQHPSKWSHNCVSQHPIAQSAEQIMLRYAATHRQKLTYWEAADEPADSKVGRTNRRWNGGLVSRRRVVIIRWHPMLQLALSGSGIKCLGRGHLLLLRPHHCRPQFSQQCSCSFRHLLDFLSAETRARARSGQK